MTPLSCPAHGSTKDPDADAGAFTVTDGIPDRAGHSEHVHAGRAIGWGLWLHHSEYAAGRPAIHRERGQDAAGRLRHGQGSEWTDAEH